MSKAVPWSGLVRTNGKPIVTFTPSSMPRYFTGIRPWSWYIAITASQCAKPRARMNTVSGGKGPVASIPSARASATAGAIVSISSRPNAPPSPACGFRPATAMRGASMPARRSAAWVMRIVSRTPARVIASGASRSARWIVTSTVRSSELASIIRTGTPPASSASSSVWPGKSCPARCSASLLIGAVTTARTSLRNASAAARAMQR